MSLHLTAMYLKYTCLEDRVALLREIHPVKATLLHRPPFVAAYGGTMSEMTVRGLVLIRFCFSHGLRFVEACPAGTHFSPVSLTQDDVRCHDWLVCMFLTAWGDVFVTSLVFH